MRPNFTQLEPRMNAEPTLRTLMFSVDGTTLTLCVLEQTHFEFPEFVNGQIIRLRFNSVWRYCNWRRSTMSGWYRGQLPDSAKLALVGRNTTMVGPATCGRSFWTPKWLIVSESPSHRELRPIFLFYFRDGKPLNVGCRVRGKTNQ